MINSINNGLLDLYSKFAVHAHAADGADWLTNAQDKAAGFAESNDVSNLPDLGLSAFILVLVGVIFFVLIGVTWNSRKATSNDARAREETHDTWKNAGVFGAVILVIIILAFIGYNILVG